MNNFDDHKSKVRLTPTQKNIVFIVFDCGQRLTGSQIMSQYENRFGPVGISTVKGALSVLVAHGYLSNRQDVRPRGYGLPDQT